VQAIRDADAKPGSAGKLQPQPAFKLAKPAAPAEKDNVSVGASRTARTPFRFGARRAPAAAAAPKPTTPSAPGFLHPGGEVTPPYAVVHSGHQDLTDAWRDSAVHADPTVPKALVVRVTLEGMTSAASVDLGISQAPGASVSDFKVSVPGKYLLRVTLPYRCDDQRASARFDKATAQLTVTLPVIPPLREKKPPVQHLAECSQVAGSEDPAHDGEESVQQAGHLHGPRAGAVEGQASVSSMGVSGGPTGAAALLSTPCSREPSNSSAQIAAEAMLVEGAQAQAVTLTQQPHACNEQRARSQITAVPSPSATTTALGGSLPSAAGGGRTPESVLAAMHSDGANELLAHELRAAAQLWQEATAQRDALDNPATAEAACAVTNPGNSSQTTGPANAGCSSDMTVAGDTSAASARESAEGELEQRGSRDSIVDECGKGQLGQEQENSTARCGLATAGKSAAAGVGKRGLGQSKRALQPVFDFAFMDQLD
jgi:PIH1 CS-like domain